MGLSLVAGLLVACAIGQAEAPRIAVAVDQHPVQLLGPDGGRAAVGRALESSGWRVDGLGATSCTTDDCLKGAATTAGASRVFVIDVSRTTGAKFRYDVSLHVIEVATGAERRGAKTCEPCLLRRDFEQTIGALAATLSAELDVEVARAQAEAARLALAAAPPPAPRLPASAPSRPWLGGSLVAGGVLAAGLGATLLYLDGRGTDCREACASRYETHGGIPLVLGGAALATAGLWLWAPWRPAGDVALVVAPSGAGIRGRF